MEKIPLVGKIIMPGDYSPVRDAVHVAITQVIAPCELRPGQHVGKDGNPHAPRAVGIVDPYLRLPVRKGQRFWLHLYPRTVTGLTHNWTHPMFDGDEDLPVAEEVEAEDLAHGG